MTVKEQISMYELLVTKAEVEIKLTQHRAKRLKQRLELLRSKI